MTDKYLRLFTDSDLSENQAAPLSAGQAHYLGKVMRRGAGDDVLLFNGRDGEWLGRLAELRKAGGIVELIRQTRPQKKTPDLWLLFAPVKRAPIDQIAQKATELGVTCLQPVATGRTIVGRVREDRLRANAIEAAEQCERLDVPAVAPLTKLAALIDAWPEKNPDRRIVFCDEAGDSADERWGGAAGRALPLCEALHAYKKNPGKWAILTGPEGGFTPAEREILRGKPYVTPATLGPRILRADTAAFAAITLWQAVLGDFTSDFTSP